MTPAEQLLEQQTLAAWVSAWAAIGQFIAAAAALLTSLWISARAAKREREAAEASAERERRIETRAERAEAEAFNRPIDLIISASPPIFDEIDAVLEREGARLKAGESGQIWGSWTSDDLRELTRRVDLVRKSPATDPALRLALDDLWRVSHAGWDTAEALDWLDYVGGLTAYRRRLRDQLDAVAALKR